MSGGGRAHRERSDEAAAIPAILLCGGEGTRLATEPMPEVDGASADGASRSRETEKPLVTVAGTPMVDRVLDALLAADRVGAVHAVTSPHTPATARLLSERAEALAGENDTGGSVVRVVEGAGEGYVADLDATLSRVGTPAVTVAADLPLLTAEDVDAAVRRAAGDSLAVCVPAALKRDVGASVDTTFTAETGTEGAEREVAPTGLNVVGEADRGAWVREGAGGRRLAVNVNRPADRRLAERLIAGDSSRTR